jgi:hypothetical protein
MPSPRRILLFKIITGTVMGFLLIVLGTKIYDLLDVKTRQGFTVNEQVNQRNKLYAAHNPYGFTDSVRTKQKPAGKLRIAVLGDSFIWGDGIPYQDVWSHKLERELNSLYPNVEVLSWGISGWSTLDELNFYRNHGKDYNIDLLIIGWVDNDPDIGRIPTINAGDATKRYPIANSIYPPLAKMLLNTANSNSYHSWMQQIYTPENLAGYQMVLDSFYHTLAADSVPALVVMTPGAYLGKDAQQHFDTIKPMLQKAGFTTLNLLPVTKQKFGNRPEEDLRANAVNLHPGILLTTLYADEVKKYLEKNGWLNKVMMKDTVAR